METVPIKAEAKKKKLKKRRLKNSLPCNINKIYIMKTGTLSKKEHKQQCDTKRMKCKQNVTFHVHEGRDAEVGPDNSTNDIGGISMEFPKETCGDLTERLG